MAVSAPTLLFTDQTASLTKLIADKDKLPGNEIHLSIEVARHVLIAIANAENIFKDRPHLVRAKKEEFQQMIDCILKTDYCRLNLTTLIQYSIDSGTEDGWMPKLQNVNPQYIVPKTGFLVEFLGD